MFKLKIIANTAICNNNGTIIIVEITDKQVTEISKIVEEAEDINDLAFQGKIVELLAWEDPNLKQNLILKKNKNIVKKRKKLFLKGYNIEIPLCFEKVLKGELSSNYVNFLKLLSLNPITPIREKLPQYVIDNNLRITDNGYIVGCRQVIKVNKDSDDYSERIKSLYFKIKTTWKKSPKKVLLNAEGKVVNKKKKSVQTLHEAFCSLPSEQKGVEYTDNHSKTFRWKIGDIMQLKKRSLTNDELVCGADMLHIRSNPQELSGFGDTNIMVLINPQDVVSCVEKWKFGVFKCYFASLMDLEDADLFKAPLQNFESDFMEFEWNEIEKALKDKGQFTFSGEEISVNRKDYSKILKERKILLNK